jgi:NAD(P)-dependent dehydrogenase (short-subunit alcohol dehydrogenase family)
MAGRLEGKVAVITGGGSGIGRATAERFAEEGADIVIADIQDDRGQESVAAVEERGRKAIYVHCDTSREVDNEAMGDAAVEAFGQIDICVAAAGISHAQYVSGADPTEVNPLTPSVDSTIGFVENKEVGYWEKVLAVNLTGVMLTDRAVVRRMLAKGNPGSIVNIASGAALLPMPGDAEYAVSKAGVWSLTRTLSVELASRGIRVNAIGPGVIETPMTQMWTDDESWMAAYTENNPLGRLGQPLDIANTALFLASDESSFFTGELLQPNGGVFTG